MTTIFPQHTAQGGFGAAIAPCNLTTPEMNRFTEKVRVLQVGNNVLSTLGGIPRAIGDMRKALGGSVISFTDPEQLAAEQGQDVLHIAQARDVRGRLYGWAPVRSSSAAEALLDRCNLMLVHGLYRYHYQWAIRQASLHRLPCVIVPHGALDPYVLTYRGTQKRLWIALLGRPTLERASVVLFATDREREKASATVRKMRAAVLHFPVQIPDLGKQEEQRKRWRSRFAIGDQDRVLAFLGRFDPAKRIPAIVRAFNLARTQNLHLIVAGPDSAELTRTQCAALVTESRRSRVHFPGAVYGEDKLSLLLAADAFVNVSVKENFGYAVCESLAAGLPGIVGPGNDLAAELAKVGCGWFPQSNDDDVLARAYSDFAAASADDIRTLGLRGRRWAREQLGFERFRNNLQQLCLDAVGR